VIALALALLGFALFLGGGLCGVGMLRVHFLACTGALGVTAGCRLFQCVLLLSG
jgi:hypothetical protein